MLAAMFVIELLYKAPLADIDKHMPAHMKFLKKYYASGHFLISGRKIPRDGGIILAVGENRERVPGSSRRGASGCSATTGCPPTARGSASGG